MPNLGRPPLPPEERASRRISVRLYAAEEEMLHQLCEDFGKREGDIIRKAIRELAKARRRAAK